MKNKLLVCIGIFLSLAFSRFIPHPPNFTSLIALSFYVPAILGIRYIPVTIISFAITDMIIGYHAGTHWTWKCLFNRFIVLFLVSKTLLRLTGALLGATIFYLITNFGVWSSGMYGYNLEGLLKCYFLAIPFFGNTLLSTLIFSITIEVIIHYNKGLFVKIKNIAS